MAHTALVSIITPCFNERDNIKALHKAIEKSLKDWQFELIYIDDGSTDKSLEVIQDLARKHQNVKYIILSRNFGQQAALRAGLRYASGSVVISIDTDLQHPPSLITTLLQKWEMGYEVVYAVRKNTGDMSILKRATSRLFYKVMNILSEFHIDEGTADFRLLDRKVVNIINNQGEADFFLRGYVSWIGFHQLAVPYTPDKRLNGNTKYTYRKMFKLATQGITQFSVKPLRLSIGIGMVFAVLGGFYGMYALLNHFTSRNEVSGWTSLIVVVLTIGGIQLMLLGVVGEYVGKTYLQAKGRPDFIIDETNIKHGSS